MNDFRKQFGSAQEGQVPENGNVVEVSAAGLNVPVETAYEVAGGIGKGIDREHIDPTQVAIDAKNAAQDSVSLEFKTVGEVDVPYDYDAKMPDGTTRREWQTAKL
jgi:hypothetical protein